MSAVRIYLKEIIKEASKCVQITIPVLFVVGKKMETKYSSSKQKKCDETSCTSTLWM